MKRMKNWHIFCYVVCVIYYVARTGLVIQTNLVCFRMGWTDINCQRHQTWYTYILFCNLSMYVIIVSLLGKSVVLIHKSLKQRIQSQTELREGMRIDTAQYYLVGLLCSWMATVMIVGIIRQQRTGLIQNNENESFLISGLVMLVNFFICYVFLKISIRQKGVFYQIDSIGNILIIKPLADDSP